MERFVFYALSSRRFLCNWYEYDKISFEGNRNPFFQFGLHQMITSPTYYTKKRSFSLRISSDLQKKSLMENFIFCTVTHISDTSSSCIDLIFTTQPNLVEKSSVHPSLLPNYHYQDCLHKV